MFYMKLNAQERAAEKIRIRKEYRELAEQKKKLIASGASKKEIDEINDKIIVLLRDYLKYLQ